jgi:hypothetical protein
MKFRDWVCKKITRFPLLPAAYRRSSELTSITKASHKMARIYSTFSLNFPTFI